MWKSNTQKITYQEGKVKKRTFILTTFYNEMSSEKENIYFFKKTTFYNEMPLQRAAAKVM